MNAVSRIVEETGSGRVEIFPLAVEPDFLFGLFRLLFENHWHEIVFGPCVQGAVFEIAVDAAPKKVSIFDGYLTVDFGKWHFHVCIGENKGGPRNPTPAGLAAHRRTARAELYRNLSPEGTPRSWGLRLFNGGGEQQITVFLPNPLLTPEMKPARPPDFARLALWDKLRERCLGLAPDPLDRTAKGFPCSG
ncbi:DUF7676 family protein [Zavarzinia compransoris]|uniref:Uncharacterized protein n=1 Tax=Zavarzinia compransoris TaxID=1264899 RepID=A0A317E030_9PROT|nr:hypothetical protein [Zavarzinia compransoris]PWR19992.1 hypothetical protein DKG75_16235 [Zavarzinia compransoris]TDP44893.1 hypothetical protein DES42_106113 [Zavarzinia compransoris]